MSRDGSRGGLVLGTWALALLLLWKFERHVFLLRMGRSDVNFGR